MIKDTVEQRSNGRQRKTEGNKLGQIIAKDLNKRLPPGTGSKAALRDPVVEVDVTGKALGEHGFLEAARSLTKALEHDGEHGRVLYVEELCLRSNKLNAACLPALAHAIRLAASHLRDLDLSDNDFTVTTSQDADAWQDFLDSFRQCRMLRRVDLSGNTLGPKAFEVLARVYSREPSIDQPWEDDAEILPCGDGTPSRKSISTNTEALHRQTRILSLDSAFGPYTNDDQEASVASYTIANGARHDSKSPEKTAHDPGISRTYNVTQGLRSVPYLILSDTGMTDAAALHLSYIISCHHHPGWLLGHVPPARSSHHLQQLEYYDVKTGCQGVVYLPNPGISIPGLKLLELCEGARFSLLDGDRPADTPDASQTHFRRASTTRKTSLTHTSPATASAGARRRSTTNGEQDELTDTEAVHAELDRARSRIQGNVLRDDGVQSNDLWRTALLMLNLCRMLCSLRKDEEPQPQLQSASSSARPSSNLIPTQPHQNNPHFPALPRVNPKSFVGYLDPFAPSSKSPHTTTPTTPCPPPKSKKYHPLKLKTATPSPLSSATSPISLSPAGPHSQPTPPYRSDLPRGLPEEAWARIMGLLLGADRFMTRRQQSDVLRWAVDRKTLVKELGSLGKPGSAQMWRVLDGMGCLAYGGGRDGG
ncbi:MAG: hypothetical protein L6R35_002341 [Caloplaca aegaea]|nr:MAG: hypothetical protein L6R35_002341 [Caloplaca aegaea]